MDLDRALAELDAKHAKERDNLIRTKAVLDALPPFALDREPRVFFHKLYGRECSIKWEHDYYRYDPEGKKPPQPDLPFLAQLAEALGPALPVVLVRDGCLSFRLAEHVEALPEEEKERWDSEQQVSPFLLKVEVYQQHTAEVSWTVRLAGIACEIEVKLPFSPAFGRLDVQYKDRMGGREVVRCEFKPADALTTLFRDQEPLAQLERPIKWASGGPQYPNSFTAHWCDLRPDTPPAPVDLARALVGAAK
jgi:hypothetical protein